MPRLIIPRKIAIALAIPGLLSVVATEATAGKLPVRPAHSRSQIDPPPPPAPDPSLGPAPGAFQPIPGGGPAPGTYFPGPSTAPLSNGIPGGPVSPVPPPEPGGAMYNGPLGTMREKPVPVKQYPGDPGGFGSNTPTPLELNQFPPPLDQNAVPPTTDRFGSAPPPGTLGQTYSRRSRLVDEKKHPRVGIVEVNLSENYDVSAKGLKSKWTGKVWELESDPLLPGIPHIFEVKAEWGPEGAKRKEVRTVRLIMGRVVDLEF